MRDEYIKTKKIILYITKITLSLMHCDGDSSDVYDNVNDDGDTYLGDNDDMI